MVMRKQVYTTGDIAAICQVAPRTVAKWFDTNLIKGFRIPFSRDRRVPHTSLIAFMTEHNIPIPTNIQPKMAA